MKLTLQTKALQAAIKLAIAVVGSGTEELVKFQPGENQLLMAAGHQTYRTIGSIPAEMDQGEVFCTYLYRLQSLLSPFNSEKISINITKSKATITSDKTSGEIGLVNDPGYFPDTTFPVRITALLDKAELIKAVQRILPAGEKNGPGMADNIQFNLDHLAIYMQATNSFKWAWTQLTNQIDGGEEEFHLNGSVLEKFLDAFSSETSTLVLASTGSLIYLGVPNNFIIMPKVVCMALPLTKALELFGTSNYDGLTVDRKEFLEAIKAAVSVFRRSGSHPIINLDISRFGIDVATNVDPVRYQTEVVVDRVIQNVDIETTTEKWVDNIRTIIVNAEYMQDIIQSIETSKMEMFIRGPQNHIVCMANHDETLEEGQPEGIYGYSILNPMGDIRKRR